MKNKRIQMKIKGERIINNLNRRNLAAATSGRQAGSEKSSNQQQQKQSVEDGRVSQENQHQFNSGFYYIFGFVVGSK